MFCMTSISAKQNIFFNLYFRERRAAAATTLQRDHRTALEEIEKEMFRFYIHGNKKIELGCAFLPIVTESQFLLSIWCRSRCEVSLAAALKRTGGVLV